MVYKDNFSILRTNVKLTSNYKILVGGEDKYISAISSDIALTDIRYKNLLYKKINLLSQILKHFGLIQIVILFIKLKTMKLIQLFMNMKINMIIYIGVVVIQLMIKV